MAKSFDKQVVVVGAGPAGMAAAIRATQGGAAVTVIDEARLPGGQIYRQPPPEFHSSPQHQRQPDGQRGEALLRSFNAVEGQLDFIGETAVLGLFDDKKLLLHRAGGAFGKRAGGTFEMRAEALVLATGAYERSVPFPGWTLPGVYTAGGCQVLLKSQAVLPGKRVLVAGTGPLLLVVARQLARAGAQVVAVAEASSYTGLVLTPHLLWGHWGLLREGRGYLRELKKAGIPFLPRHTIIEARGEGQVREAVIARLDHAWRPLPGSERTLEVDTVAMGFGFIPNTELSRMAGCEHYYDARQGGWLPVRGSGMETTLPGIYSVGDGAGVAGALVAELEGQLAGLAALRQLGAGSSAPKAGAELERAPGAETEPEAEPEARQLRKRLAALGRFRRAMDRISVPRPGLLSLCAPDTVVCRCEEVTLAEIAGALAEGSRSLDNLKRRTRAGMGLCQGRTCLPHVAALAAQASAKDGARNSAKDGAKIRAIDGALDEAQAGWHRPRPPLRPVPISELAGGGVQSLDEEGA